MQLSNRELKKILTGCRLNKRNRQKELYRGFYSYAMSIVFLHTENDDQAAEIINNAFLKIYQDLAIFAPPFAHTVITFKAMFKKIIWMAAVNHKRKYNVPEIPPGVFIETGTGVRCCP